MDIRKHFDAKLMIFLTTLAVIAGIVVGQVQSVIGWIPLLLSTVLVGSIFFFVAHIMINIFGANLENKISNKLLESKTNLDKSIITNHTKLDCFTKNLIKISEHLT